VHFPDATPDDNLKKLPFDNHYVQNASMWLDLSILWKTIMAIG
jgi:lipopolysaccharide/colanic/teichoic acid biosynthesis glycosyltransferase